LNNSTFVVSSVTTSPPYVMFQNSILVKTEQVGVCKHKCFLAKMFYQNIGPSSVHVFHMY
jgi:hypothetical protein